jgi:hypothetical protein
MGVLAIPCVPSRTLQPTEGADDWLPTNEIRKAVDEVSEKAGTRLRIAGAAVRDGTGKLYKGKVDAELRAYLKEHKMDP